MCWQPCQNFKPDSDAQSFCFVNQLCNCYLIYRHRKPRRQNSSCKSRLARSLQGVVTRDFMHGPYDISHIASISPTGDDWCSCSCRKNKYHISPRQVSPSPWILTLIWPFLYGLWCLKNLYQVLRHMSPCVELWGAHLEALPNNFTALQHTYFLQSSQLLD